MAFEYQVTNSPYVVRRDSNIAHNVFCLRHKTLIIVLRQHITAKNNDAYLVDRELLNLLHCLSRKTICFL